MVVGASTHGYLGHVNVIECPNKCKYSVNSLSQSSWNARNKILSVTLALFSFVHRFHQHVCTPPVSVFFRAMSTLSWSLPHLTLSWLGGSFSLVVAYVFPFFGFFFSVAFFFKSASVALVASFFTSLAQCCDLPLLTCDTCAPALHGPVHVLAESPCFCATFQFQGSPSSRRGAGLLLPCDTDDNAPSCLHPGTSSSSSSGSSSPHP